MRAKLALIAILSLASFSLPTAAHSATPPTRAPHVGAWLPYWEWNTPNTQARQTLTSIDAFDYYLTDTSGQVHLEPRGNPDQLRNAISALARRHTTTYLTITDETAGSLSDYLNNPDTRTQLAEELATTATNLGVHGIDLDIESFAFHDNPDTWADTEERWVSFIQQTADTLDQYDLKLSVSSPVIYNGKRDHTSGYWVYAWDRIGPYIDTLRIMAYDYSYSSPGPIGPLPWTRTILNYATTTIDPQRIELGVAAYGRNWVTDITGTCPDTANTRRTTLTMDSAREVAKLRNATPRYDTTTGEATYSYTVTYTDGTDTCTVARTAWYPTTKSIRARINLAAHYNLSGIHIWNAGTVNNATWKALSRMKKRGQIARHGTS